VANKHAVHDRSSFTMINGNCITMPNLVAISQNVGEMAIFPFSRWRPPPSWIVKITDF